MQDDFDLIPDPRTVWMHSLNYVTEPVSQLLGLTKRPHLLQLPTRNLFHVIELKPKELMNKLIKVFYDLHVKVRTAN